MLIDEHWLDITIYNIGVLASEWHICRCGIYQNTAFPRRRLVWLIAPSMLLALSRAGRPYALAFGDDYRESSGGTAMSGPLRNRLNSSWRWLYLTANDELQFLWSYLPFVFLINARVVRHWGRCIVIVNCDRCLQFIGVVRLSVHTVALVVIQSLMMMPWLLVVIRLHLVGQISATHSWALTVSTTKERLVFLTLHRWYLNRVNLTLLGSIGDATIPWVIHPSLLLDSSLGMTEDIC